MKLQVGETRIFLYVQVRRKNNTKERESENLRLGRDWCAGLSSFLAV